MKHSTLYRILAASLALTSGMHALNVPQAPAVSLTPALPSTQGTMQLGAMLGSSAEQIAQAARLSRMGQFDDLLGEYITTHYNNSDYASVISQDSSHLLTLLRAVRRADFGDAGVVYASTILKLFHDKLKAAELIDDCVIERTLSQFPTMLGGYFRDEQTETGRIQDTVRHMLLASFTSHLSSLTNSSGNLLDALATRVAGDVTKQLGKKQGDGENVVHLRYLVIRMVENMIGKAGFSYTSYESFVPSLRSIAHQITRLVDAGIIVHADNYDSCMWSLVHRACYFLDLAGSAFPLAFYEELEADLEDGEILFLEDAELDEHIVSKKQTFAEAVAKAKLRAIAYHRGGIISQPMV